jgi:hypothetical protein
MKKLGLILLLAICAAVGMVAVEAQAAGYGRQHLSADGAIGGTANSNTTVLRMEVVCLTWNASGASGSAGMVPCTFGIRQYASVTTGNLLDDNVYSLTVSGGTHTFESYTWQGQVRNNFPNGAYFDNLTGTTRATIHYLK